MKTIDFYIIKKFLGTFFYAISLLILIVIIFDVSENIDEFIDKEAPLNAIIFDYYLNFIPYFINLFSYLFTFISVIYFTSKMAANSEIIAILSSGISLLADAPAIFHFGHFPGAYFLLPRQFPHPVHQPETKGIYRHVFPESFQEQG